MSRRKKATPPDGVWNDDWGFCKGVTIHHSYNRETARWTAADAEEVRKRSKGKAASGVIEWLKCRNCPNERRSLIMWGHKPRRRYMPPAGYRRQPVDAKGNVQSREEIREEYIRSHMTKGR